MSNALEQALRLREAGASVRDATVESACGAPEDAASCLAEDEKIGDSASLVGAAEPLPGARRGSGPRAAGGAAATTLCAA